MDLIDSFRGEHSHPPNPLKVRAMMEEREVVEQIANSAENVKPSHLLSTVHIYFLHHIFVVWSNFIFNIKNFIFRFARTLRLATAPMHCSSSHQRNVYEAEPGGWCWHIFSVIFSCCPCFLIISCSGPKKKQRRWRSRAMHPLLGRAF